MNKQNQQQFIGVILISIIYLLWAPFGRGNSSVSKENKTNTTEASPEGTSFIKQLNAFASTSRKVNTVGKSKTLILENSNIKYIFSPNGARLIKVIDKTHNDVEGKPLVLMDESSAIDWRLFAKNSGPVLLSERSFACERDSVGHKLTFTYNKGTEKAICISWSLEKSGLLRFFIKLGSGWGSSKKAQLLWYYAPHNPTRSKNLAQSYSYLNFRQQSGEYSYMRNVTKEDKPDGKHLEQTQWVSFHIQHFFQSIIFGNHPVVTHVAAQDIDEGIAKTDAKLFKQMALQADFDTKSLQRGHSVDFYFGPTIYRNILNVAERHPNVQFNENYYFGISFVGIINKYINYPCFQILCNLVSHPLIALFLLLLLLMVVLFPITYKGHLHSIKMKSIKPYLEKVKAENPDNTRMSESILCKKLSLNPLWGIWPNLVNGIVLYACMFMLLYYAIEFRHVRFLWMQDLTTYDDTIPLPFSIPILGPHISLMGPVIIIVRKLISYLEKRKDNVVTTSSAKDPSAGVRKVMVYVAPLFTLCIFNKRISVIAIYMLLNIFLTLLQKFVCNRLTNIKAIEEEITRKASILDEEAISGRIQTRLERRISKKK